MIRYLLSVALIATLSACAQQATEIAPVSFAGAYDRLSCSRAETLYREEASKVPALVEAQRKAVTGDAVGVFLIGVPTSSLSGNDQEGEIAATKGKLLALEARLNVCGKKVEPVNWDHKKEG